MADQGNNDALITDFCGLTGASPQEAQQFLEANKWDLSSAATEFYTSQEEGIEEAHTGADHEPEVPENYTGPRTLDGRPAPQAASSSRAAAPSNTAAPPKRGGIATLGSLGGGEGSHAGHGHDDDDDDSDYEPEEQPRDLFAGGEKSGLAVQDPSRGGNDPRKIVNDLIKKAQAGAPRPGRSEPAAAPSRFHGTGMTLGGDDTPSQAIPDPRANAPRQFETVTRILHFWADGFSVEDGPLHRFDDPQNAADLALIRSGRAPLHLMNVTRDQEVDVQLDKHDENYKPPPKKYTPFGGGGQRLGSPTPGAGSSNTTTSAPAPVSAATASSAAPVQEVDESQPTLSIRLQLANGQRLPARFNATHTIGDVYGFIERAYPGANDRQWVLATTFPNKEHADKTLKLGEMAEFKKGGTAVQKWV